MIEKEYATMKTNKISKVLALSMLGLLALTACDNTITAKPTQYDDPLITTPTYDEELYNNIASVVYDAIENDGIGSDVLNEVLYLYGVSTFGPLNSKVKVNNSLVPENEITLEQAATDATKIDAFVLKHKAYWDGDSHEASTATASEVERVKAKYNTIEERIAIAMYDKIASGSYSDRHEFYEERFLKSLRASMESVANPSDASVTPYPATQILPEVEPEEVFETYLHRAYYDGDNRYIVDKVVPDIYRELLTEQYVLDETYNTLGRAYAREVNIIKFSNNENDPNAAYYLAQRLVDEINAKPSDYASGAIATYEADPEIEDGVLERFKDYSKAQIGDDLSTTYDDILDRSDLKKVASAYPEIGNYYVGTTFGDLSMKYEKMKNVSEFGINVELENSFTNNGAYPTTVGLAQQKMELAENDATTNGWFIKNGGLTDLPEAIRSRLFNIGVATGVIDKESEKTDAANNRSYDETNDKWVEAANEKGYVCRINGHYYLKKASRVGDEKINYDILHYDSSSKAYYIIEIKQAASSSKLSKTGDRNYANLISEEKMQEIVNEVTKIVAKGETYSTLATKKYLKAMGIEYHDQSVYDYFKSNYPELFGEDEDSSSDTSESTSETTSE